jgi:hypothetical protein
MRVIIELHRTEANTVHGVVIADAGDSGEPQRFTGWLELLRLLEALAPPALPTSTGATQARTRRCH